MGNAIETFKLNPLEHAGRRVITLAMMDEAHQRPAGTAKRTFRQHREQLRENEDFFRQDAARPTGPGGRKAGQEAEILLTESGYLLLVKAFRDPLAWQVQRDLVAGYFRARSAAADPLMAMALDQISHLHAVVCNFIQGSIAAQERRLEGLQYATEQRFTEVERQVKQLRRGSRVSAMGRGGGKERKVKPRAPKALVAAPMPLQLPGVKP